MRADDDVNIFIQTDFSNELSSLSVDDTNPH